MRLEYGLKDMLNVAYNRVIDEDGVRGVRIEVD
jgi:hypothetical protein